MYVVLTIFIIQAKLASRLARRQEEARRKAEEDSAKRILEEQSKALAANKPVDAEHVAVPEVVMPRETSEEQVRDVILTASACFVLLVICVFT